MTMMNVCVRCRRDFTSLIAFDKHQDVSYKRVPAVECKDPAAIGLVQNAAGRWHEPQSAAGALRLRNLRASQGPG
jgi:hypothetical protein